MSEFVSAWSHPHFSVHAQCTWWDPVRFWCFITVKALEMSSTRTFFFFSNIVTQWSGPWIWHERAHLNFRWDVLSVDAPTMVAIELEGETTGALWLQSYKSPLALRGSLIAIMKISFGASIASMGSLMIMLLICEFSQSCRKTEQNHTLSHFPWQLYSTFVQLCDNTGGNLWLRRIEWVQLWHGPVCSLSCSVMCQLPWRRCSA